MDLSRSRCISISTTMENICVAQNKVSLKRFARIYFFAWPVYFAPLLPPNHTHDHRIYIYIYIRSALIREAMIRDDDHFDERLTND